MKEETYNAEEQESESKKPLTKTERLNKTWKRVYESGAVIIGVASLPYIEPMLDSFLLKVYPPLKAIISVSYPKELLDAWGKISHTSCVELVNQASDFWQQSLAAGFLTTTFLVVSLTLAGYAFFGRFLPTAIRKAKERRPIGIIRYTFALLGLLIWLGLSLELLSNIIPFNNNIAGAFLPNSRSVDSFATYFRHVIDLWSQINVSYFGWNNSADDFMLDFERSCLKFEIWWLGLTAMFSASALLKPWCTWTALLKGVPPGTEEEDDDDRDKEKKEEEE